VKPQNVLLNGDGHAKVTDFGIARSLDVDHGMTLTGTVIGTSNYIAPEQASGRSVDERTDVYSLGVVLFELLTGDVPFPGESFVAVAMRHVHEQPPWVAELRPDVPPRVAQAVDRALAKDPDERFPSMATMVAELRACLDEEAAPEERTMIVPPPSRRGKAPPPRRRGRAWPFVVLLVALAVGAAVAVWALTRADPGGRDGGAGDGSDGGGAKAVKVSAVASYDPEGDGQEHPEAVGRATDGDPATYWTTESYESFSQTKQGVGLVLDAGDSSPKQLVVRSSTPGFSAEIRSGPSAGGPFGSVVSPARAVGGETAFPLGDAAGRYLVLWITQLPAGRARVEEITAS
jgi:serine/threonine-protein kinase